MPRHTPKPVVDVSAAIPELAPLARTAVRLHPRLGDTAADQSKIGGEFLWPRDEPWPTCSEHGSSLVTVLQVREEDVPELGFRPNTDLFQLLWCPNDHEKLEPTYIPAAMAFWRRRDDVKESLQSAPLPDRFEPFYCPVSCVLHPERVREYPHIFELSDFFRDLFDKISASPVLTKAVESIEEFEFPDNETLYQYWLSVADGTKIGGYPLWPQNPETPNCTCGKAMEFLLAVSGGEFDGGTWGRWLAEEERSVWGGDPNARFEVQDAAGLAVGLSMGKINYFICRACADWPLTAVYQR